MKGFQAALTIMVITIASQAHSDGLWRSLGSMTVADSSMPCDIQMYHINAFKSELSKLKLNRDCQGIESRSATLLESMAHINPKLCSTEEVAQLERWNQRISNLHQEAKTRRAPYCQTIQTGKRDEPEETSKPN